MNNNYLTLNDLKNRIVTLSERDIEIRERMLKSFEAIKRDLSTYVETNPGRFIVFGSFVKGTFRNHSDLDIVVDFPKDTVSDAWQFAEDACSEHGLKQDVRSIYFCSDRFMKKIMEYAEVIGQDNRS